MLKNRTNYCWKHSQAGKKHHAASFSQEGFWVQPGSADFLISSIWRNFVDVKKKIKHYRFFFETCILFFNIFCFLVSTPSSWNFSDQFEMFLGVSFFNRKRLSFVKSLTNIDRTTISESFSILLNRKEHCKVLKKNSDSTKVVCVVPRVTLIRDIWTV